MNPSLLFLLVAMITGLLVGCSESENKTPEGQQSSHFLEEHKKALDKAKEVKSVFEQNEDEKIKKIKEQTN